ncbi:hypothetical protein [Klebsiella variicola]|nr:hypothetical protein [Klebsiella variicola]
MMDSAHQVGTLCNVLAGIILHAIHEALRYHHVMTPPGRSAFTERAKK